jgi:hypothetical protein
MQTTPTRRVVNVLLAALATSAALTGAAHAQVSGSSPATPVPDPIYSQGMDGSGVVPLPRTRGVFVATLVALIAQGLGNGVGTALSQGLGGSITKWFAGDSGTETALPGPSGQMSGLPSGSSSGLSLGLPSAGGPEPAPALQAGVAYEVHLIGSDGSARAVDPARYQFHTGDRFQLHYRPTLPGRVQVFNVNPLGAESRIDTVEVAAGQLASLGPYRFVEPRGDETMKLVLEPCSTPLLTAATRSIVKVAAPSVAEDAPLRIGTCGDVTARGLRAKPRSIRKTTMDGATAFALDPLSADEIGTGQIGARELQIALRHR